MEAGIESRAHSDGVSELHGRRDFGLPLALELLALHQLRGNLVPILHNRVGISSWIEEITAIELTLPSVVRTPQSIAPPAKEDRKHS